jgi:hypothetical protein
MKLRIFALIIFLLAGGVVSLEAQQDRPSPPAEVSGMIGDAEVTINYSQPGVKGREIWGGLVPYDQVWRTGANEATKLTVKGSVKFDVEPEVTLEAGSYSLFTIPREGEWTVIINSVAEQWGHFNYDESKDVVRFAVTPEKTDEFAERMTFSISDGNIVFHWENLKFTIPVVG